ncbi:MAG: sulfatase-like hydrolase/transferase, partial [Victivallales bacterium]|nr:sulfatase-like hydrolase/transferase [Victivallales bacterium]
MKPHPTIPPVSPYRPIQSRRGFLRLGALGGASLLTPRIGLSQATPTKPNLVFVLSDDQDWTGTSVRMHPDVPSSASRFYRTPALEAFAKQGMRFSSAYAPAPVCSPTRYSLQTGKSPAQLHWTKAAPVMTAASGYKLIPPTIVRQISSRETTIGEILQRVGYATAHYGKWHLRGGGPGQHGYDEHDGDTSNKDAAPFKDPNPVDIFGITERASAFMEKNTREGRPFFMQLSHHALHYPENARQTTLAAYRQRTTKSRQVVRGA